MRIQEFLSGGGGGGGFGRPGAVFASKGYPFKNILSVIKNEYL